MANMITECETIGTRSKRRKLANEKDDTSLYKTSNEETIHGKDTFETPDESMSELEESVSRSMKSMSRSTAYSKSGMNKYDEKSDDKIKINSNNISGNKNRNKSKSPLSNEKTNIDHLPIRSILENEEYISTSKSKQKNRTSCTSLSSTTQKEILNNKIKKLSLDADVSNCEIEKKSNSPECKLGKNKFSSKDDISSNKPNKKKANKNVNCKNNNEIESNIRTRSKSKVNVLQSDDSIVEMLENKIQTYRGECSFNEPDFENSPPVKAIQIMETISPIQSHVKRTNTFKTNIESEEEFSESSEQSNDSIMENVSKNPKSDNYGRYSSETDSQCSKENYSPDESNVKIKSYTKSLKNDQKSRSKISKKNLENCEEDFSRGSENSDDSVINESQDERVSRVTHRKKSEHSKGGKIKNSKTKASSACNKPISAEKRKSISEESSDFSPNISAPQSGRPKKTRAEDATSKPKTPIKRKSQRLIKADPSKSNISDEVDQTQPKSAKKRTSTAKSPRTPSLSHHASEELGLSWDKKSTPARRYSLRLKKTNSEYGTPVSSTSIRHSSIGNTPTPSKRKQLLNIGLTNQLDKDSDSDSKQPKQSSRQTAANTKRKLKKLDMNDSDLSSDSDNDLTPVISSRNSTPRRTPRKSAGKDSNQLYITKSTPKKTSQRKSSHK